MLPAGERERIEAEIQQHLDEAERLVARLDALNGFLRREEPRA